MHIPSDIQLGAATANLISRPRIDPADSFVLHAPLELAARIGLLAWVRPSQRDLARQRITEVGEQYEASGAAVPPPRQPLEIASAAEAASQLRSAIAAGELDDADAAALALAGMARAAELPGLLADTVLTSLAAAGHAPILLHLLPRVAPRGELPVELLRPLVRELARHPDWRLTWFDQPQAGAGPDDLAAALTGLPALGVNGSTFIYPTMLQVEATGVAAAHLHRAVEHSSVDDATRTITRLAATSMLVEPHDHAPFGWSHALTMPQAVLSVANSCADPRRAVAVAATYLAGFRTSIGVMDLSTPYDPPPPAGDLDWALHDCPASAAAAVWHAEPGSASTIMAALASRAATHHDAHVVKYTLACFDATAIDPAAARTYLAAAARLIGVWIEHPDPSL